ncbi:MAG: 2Fe-2S iron-sulfur cluster-binding protein [bacterium]
MPKVNINGTEIEVDKGTTILRAAADAGFDVPHFCYHPALSIPANCRMCLVEVEGMPKLQPGCYTQVNEGMVVKTKSERVIKARKAVLEFILLNHPVDCPICDQAGECKLQDYYVDYDAQESRQRTDKQNKVKAYPLGPEVVYDGERCILCTRCIRFCDEVTQSSELTIVERGDRAEIRTFPGRELDNAYSMCVVDLCPVGALTSRDFRFKCRVWLLTSTDSVCTGCSTGCSIHLDHFRNTAQRYRPRYNPRVNDYWMCDKGRLSYKQIHDDRNTAISVNGADVNWHAATEALAPKLAKAVEDGGDGVAFLVSPQATVEDLFVAKQFASNVLKTSNFYMGGNAPGESDKFLIRADKNPNTGGIAHVFGSMAALSPFPALVEAMEAGKVKVLYMMGAQTPCNDEMRARFVAALEKVGLFVFQSAHAAELSGKANFVLPACTHAEKDGTFINFEGVRQAIHQAFAPHGASLPDWQIFMRVARAMKNPMSYTFLAEIQKEAFAAKPVIEAEPAAEQPAPSAE